MKQPRGEVRRKGSLIKEWAGRDGVGRRGGEKGCFARRALKKGERVGIGGGRRRRRGSKEKGESEGQSRESSSAGYERVSHS